MADDVQIVGLRANLVMASNGRVVIPADIRAALGIRDGGKLIARIENGALVLETVHAALAKVQAMVREYVPEGTSLVDELIAERRAEVERE